ncbi:MAG: hypothetical protein AB9873_05385 [Syntrophobacteraceae bacterium]
MNCEKCGTVLDPQETYEHSGRTVCEDCYLDLVAVPKTCDPWAVHSAKNTPNHEKTLLPQQEQILELLRSNDPLSAEQICSRLALSPDEFRSHFASLRHMELARGTKIDNEVRYTLFAS